jgi:hypothetical protein
MRMSESTPQNGRQQILPAPSMGTGKTLRGVTHTTEDNLGTARLSCPSGTRNCRKQQGKRVKRQYLRKSSSFGRSSHEKPMSGEMGVTTDHRSICEGGVDHIGTNAFLHFYRLLCQILQKPAQAAAQNGKSACLMIFRAAFLSTHPERRYDTSLVIAADAVIQVLQSSPGSRHSPG